LIASIEGRTGRPTVRPPFPAQKGLYGKPTNINNVETWSNVPAIIARSGEWFAKIGTAQSSGTKVFSLVGKIKNTGLVEMPMGTKLQDIIYGNGGGAAKSKKIKAVQTGGPSGGCIPADLFSTNVDYESLSALGAIMGSGGMVVMDEDNCMVDVARYFLEFTTAESCGKCVPCREGLMQLLAIVKNIATGEGTMADLEKLKVLSRVIKDSALCGLGKTGPNPVLTTMQYFYEEYIEHIKNRYCRAGVCQELFVAPCENSCPLHMNIPGYLELYKEGRTEEAFELILRDNPLPATLGRICHFHCKLRCRREDIDSSVQQGEVHRLIADTIYENKKEQAVYEKLVLEKLPRTRKKIAIVGSGPAALTAAYYLVRLGHEVVVYERTDELGGVLRWGIPEYRLPKKVLHKETVFLKKLGVRFLFFKELGQNLKLKELKAHYDKIVLALGAQKEINLGVPGEDAAGVIQGIKFLNRVSAGQKIILGKKVIVVGGGNVAIDAARTALRLGAEVTVVYRRDRDAMPANRYELASAEKEGIKFEFNVVPKQFIVGERGKVSAVEMQVLEPGEWDQSGRRKSVPLPEVKKRFVDTVILAIGERVKTDILEGTDIKLNKNGFPEIDIRNFQTTDPLVHAIGDLVLGPATAAEAMGQGRQLAEQLDLELVPVSKKEEPRFNRLFRQFNYENKIPSEPQGNKGSVVEELKLTERIKDFREVSLGLTSKQAENECLRCLRCDVKESARGSK
jgi:NADH-quinone oxidoreductase subunit F